MTWSDKEPERFCSNPLERAGAHLDRLAAAGQRALADEGQRLIPVRSTRLLFQIRDVEVDLAEEFLVADCPLFARYHSGILVDAASKLYDGTPLTGPDDLRGALLTHKEAVLRAFTEYLMTYALGRRIESSDGPAIRAIVRDAAKSGYRFSSFALGVAKSAAFTRGQAQPAPSQRAVDMAASASDTSRPVSENRGSR